jgi:hypothetical protein
MRKPDTIIIDGHAFSWRRLCDLRRQQLAEWAEAHPAQPALFEVRDDARPITERTAAGRYFEPSLLDFCSK